MGCGRRWTLSPGHIPSNLPLGVGDSMDFGQVVVSVEAGDRVAIYTDGITECTNASGEEFGQERLCALLEGCGALDLAATKRCLLESLRRATPARLLTKTILPCY